jgi:cellulose synthase/poly-beta-1,6-N-acetylglucosamine synthase-like glycosyltransferase
VGGLPLVSVVLPVRDGERYVEAAVESVLRQTFDDFELIVLDDGSTDATPEIVANLAPRDARLRVIRADHRGLIATLNHGCEVARGKYIARMDADDIAMDRRLEAQVGALEAEVGLGLLGAAVIVVDADLRERSVSRYPLTDKAIRTALEYGSPFAHSVVMMRKSLVERTGGYRPAYVHAEDYDLWLRMADVSRLANLRQPLLRYRTHSNQVSMTNARQQVVSVVAAQIAAAARKMGRPEPFATDRHVTQADLERSQGDASLLTERLTAAATVSAMQMIMMNHAELANELIHWVDTIAPAVRLPRRSDARRRLTLAAIYWFQRQRWRSIKEGLGACRSDPVTTLATVCAAARALSLGLNAG